MKHSSASVFFSRKNFGLIFGLVVFLIFILLPAPEGLSPQAMRVAAVTLLMAIWWVTEALPIYATALAPMALFPLLGVLEAQATAVNYGHHFILLLIGGFIIAAALERHGLHRRFALTTIKLIGASRRKLVLSFMLASAFLSMWIANVTVALLMTPIAMAVLNRLENEQADSRFGVALLLAIAYAANIGGVGTLIGTPTNLVLPGVLKSAFPDSLEITFFSWMAVGLPVVIILLPVAFFYLIRYFSISGKADDSPKIIQSQLDALGAMNQAEKRVLIIFVLAAAGWIFRSDFQLGALEISGWASLLGVEKFVTDATVAIFFTMLLFALPSGVKQGERMMDWETANRIPWGMGVLVGGGFALAKAYSATGLAKWLGGQMTFLQNLPLLLTILLIALFLIFFTEVNTNTGTANIFLPVLASVAVAQNADPLLLLFPATFACSCVFCLPSGTGVNAVVFGSGKITLPEMARCGFLLNIAGALLIGVVVYLMI